jgi:maltoporin
MANSKMFKFFFIFQKILLDLCGISQFSLGAAKTKDPQNKGPSCMRMPLLPIRFRPATNSSSRPRARGTLLGLIAGATSLSLGSLCAQSDAEINELKAQMQQMQQDYEKRLAAMESQVKSMQSQVALTASVAKSRTITGPDGKAIAMEGPVLLPPLDTFTRNFKFHTYFRAGTGFTANGVGQTFNFNTPDISFGKTQRLGNENDFYVEVGPIWDHMLGDPALDNPDVMDVKAKMTFQVFDGVDKSSGVNLDNDGFGIGMVECYLEMKNVIKAAPEVTFWGGQRFYDRYDIHPSDYFFLNTSGFGAGVYNVPLGPGSLAIAYFGGIRSGTGTFFLDDTSFDNFTLDVDGGTGDFYRHVFDVRWGDWDFLWGKTKLVLIGSYQHGGNFTVNYNDGTTGQGHVDNSGGVGGGLVQQWDLPPSWGKLSFVQLGLLFGWGLVDFDPSGVNLDKLSNAYLSALAADGITLSPDGTADGPFRSVDPYNNSLQGRANIFWVWNPTDNFSLGTWAQYRFDDQGFTSYQVNADGSVSSARGETHLFSAGIRPYLWLWGPFAIQAAAAYAYLSENRRTGAAFGDGGSLGIITIAPTIKPRGGFFTRPELRAFATFAVWSDDFKGAIGAPAYSEKNYGWLFGVQAETWF